MPPVRWYHSTLHGRDVPQFDESTHAYTALCSAAWYSVDARQAALGDVPGGVRQLARAQALCELADRRIGRWAADHPDRLDDVDRNGLCGPLQVC